MHVRIPPLNAKYAYGCRRCLFSGVNLVGSNAFTSDEPPQQRRSRWTRKMFTTNLIPAGISVSPILMGASFLREINATNGHKRIDSRTQQSKYSNDSTSVRLIDEAEFRPNTRCNSFRTSSCSTGCIANINNVVAIVMADVSDPYRARCFKILCRKEEIF